MELVDVAVVGGGPAGASAAKEAAGRGLSVLLFDHAHPRRKACGGGLPVKGIEWMDAPDSAIECHMESISFSYNNNKLKIPVKKGKLIRRDDWDFYLYNRAKEAGAGHIVERVKSLEQESGVWTINGKYKAKYIIGADGVNGLRKKNNAEIKDLSKDEVIDYLIENPNFINDNVDLLNQLFSFLNLQVQGINPCSLCYLHLLGLQTFPLI